MIQLECKDMTLGYEGVPVTEHIDFSVHQGEYLFIIGENGSGKSTLIKTLLKLKSPMAGSISFYNGVQHTEIGYLPQQTEVQRDFPASVWEIVLSGCLNAKPWRPFYTKKQKVRAKEKMEQLGILNLEKACYRNLSGGQQQRVLLARALCATQKMLLLDEPVTGLDPKAQTELYDLIETLHQKGITVIMVSHDLEAAKKYATHILQIGKEQLFFGTKQEFLEKAGKNNVE